MNIYSNVVVFNASWFNYNEIATQADINKIIRFCYDIWMAPLSLCTTVSNSDQSSVTPNWKGPKKTGGENKKSIIKQTRPHSAS